MNILTKRDGACEGFNPVPELGRSYRAPPRLIASSTCSGSVPTRILSFSAAYQGARLFTTVQSLVLSSYLVRAYVATSAPIEMIRGFPDASGDAFDESRVSRCRT